MSSFSGTDRYRPVQRLGAGAYGVVYEVRDTERDRTLAAKVLSRLGPQDLFRFKREFRRFADLRHPNLVRMHDLVAEGDLWFFTMDLVEGQDWLAYVRRTPDADPESTWSLEEARGEARLERVRETLPQIVGGLTALHSAGFVHRDVKPSNMLVTPEGQVLILDFGMATGASAMEVDHTLHAAGTPLYMAPEQTDTRRISPAADWYAVGGMLYQALTGVPPFEGTHALQLITKKMLERPRSFEELGVEAPAFLETLTMDLLATAPGDRPTGPEILARMASAPLPPSEPVASATASACVGRDAELGQLLGALRREPRDAPHAVLVVGESGVGKSALLRAFLAQASAETVVLESRCNQRESLPFKAIDPVVDDLTDFLVRLPATEAAAVLPRDVGALCRLFPVLERVPAVASAHRHSVGGAAVTQARLAGFDALREMLARIADRRPVVIAIDDAQWGDEDSARLLVDLLSPPAAPAMLLLLCARPGEMHDGPLLRALTVARGPKLFDARIELGPLGAREAEQLAEALLGAGTSEGLARAVASEAAGNPFFVEQLVRHLAESMPDETGRFRLGDLVLRRRRSVSKASRALLDLVCVAGAPLDRAVLAAATGLPGEACERALDALLAGGLARPVGDRGARVEAYHDRIHEEVARSLSASARAGHHRALAEALLATGAHDAETVFRHLYAAEEWAKARTFAAEAADQAMEGLAFNHAAELYGRALELTPEGDPRRSPLSEALGLALGAAGRSEQSATALLAAAAAVEDDTDELRLRHMAAEQLIASGEVERGFEVLLPVARRLSIRWPRTVAGMIFRTLCWHVYLLARGLRYRPREASAVRPVDRLRVDLFLSLGLSLGPSDLFRSGYFSLRALGEALRLGEPLRVARCRMVYESFAVATDPRNLERVNRTLDQIHGDLGERADAMAHAHLEYARGMVHLVGGYWVEAEEALRRTRDAVAALREPPSWLSRGTYNYWLVTLTVTGRYRELALEVKQQLRSARERGDRLMETVLQLGEPSLVSLCADEPEAALRHRDTAIARWGARLGPTQRYLSHQVLVMAHLYAGRGQLALASSTPDWVGMHRWFAGIHAMRSGARSLRCRALVGAAAELPSDEARRPLREAARLARGMLRARRAWSDALALPVLAAIAHQRGQHGEARRHLAAAVVAARSSGLAGYGAASKRRLGELTGGATGTALVAEATQWMRDEGIRDPMRFTRALAPGFPDPVHLVAMEAAVSSYSDETLSEPHGPSSLL